MTKRHLAAALVPMLLVLIVGMVPAVGRAGEPAATASTAQVPPATPPVTTAPEARKSAEKLFGGDLFTPAPIPMCKFGACFGDGTPCGPNGDGVCSAPSGGCGVCIF